MSKLFITGDCHGDFNRFATRNFPQLKEMGRDDYVIITGDHGGVWAGEQADRRIATQGMIYNTHFPRHRSV